MIDSIQIISERHGGSRWVTNLLRTYSSDIKVCDLEKHGFVNEYKLKHFLDTSLATIDKMKRNAVEQQIDYDNFNDLTTDNKLIIIITRHVYDGLLGMKKEPHHCRNKEEIMTKMTISKFLRSKGDNPRDEVEWAPIVENVIDLRTKKYMNGFTLIPTKCNNVEVIPYETLLVDPRPFLQIINNKYNLNKNITIPSSYENTVGQMKMNDSIYFNKWRLLEHFSKEDIDFVESYLNSTMEKELGYGLKDE